VRAGYLEMAKQEPKRWVVIDAGRERGEVQEALRGAVRRALIPH
jgi:thymidylate kinase